ncbi:MAG: heme biosynthesis HemY N-terminal domain-containing protein [Paracoccaceae bacterium]
MLWSLLRILLFVLVVVALAFGAGVLMETGGGVRIALAGWEFTLGPIQAVIAALVMLAALWLVLKLVGLLVATIRFLNGDETAISRYFSRDRQQRGYQALSDAMVALAGGEARLAIVKAERAQRYLDKPELTNLLIAQAAEAAGDTRRASDAYRKLLGDEKTRFVAIRGLMMQQLAEGDTDTALKLAEKAFALRPRHAETQDILLKLQAGRSDWAGARATLGAKLKSGALPRDVFRRRDAVLALQEARGVMDENASIEAREAAIEANRQSPDLIPAAVMAARAYIAKGDARHATRVLKKAWEAQPHPDLAAAFAEIAPDESPAERVRRFRTLTDIAPDHPETRMLLAELLIAAEDFPGARRALGDLVTREPTQRALAIMAAIERGEGADDTAVRGWLAKALTASRGPQWCCDKCHAIHSQWQPVCDNCGGFDTLSWRVPVEGTGPSPTGAELLPLLVNPPAPPPPEPAPEPEKEDDPIDLVAVVRNAV